MPLRQDLDGLVFTQFIVSARRRWLVCVNLSAATKNGICMMESVASRPR
jgi:hypothetical protein